MSFMGLFKKKKVNSANLAKERLKIIVAHSRSSLQDQPDFLPKMRQEILDVVRRYIDIDLNDINANIATDGESEVLELNITLPDQQELKAKQPKETTEVETPKQEDGSSQ